MRLTHEALEGAYNFLKACRPFHRWKLPDADDLEFRVTRHKDRFGHFDDRDGKFPFPNIAISEIHVKDCRGLLEVMAHELVHVALFRAGDGHWEDHGRAFKAKAKTVCKEFGFDPKTF